MFLDRLTSLSLSHNLLDSLAQLAVSSPLLLQVRISVADPDPLPDPHVFGPPDLAQPLPQGISVADPDPHVFGPSGSRSGSFYH
jgi:hypothetical protein